MSGDLRLPSLNIVTISGRLTRDPDVRYSQSGQPWVRMGMAFDRFSRDSSGETKRESNFIDIVAFRKTAEIAQEQLHKGSPLIVEGTLQIRNWETNDNQQRKSVEIIASRIHPLQWGDRDQPQQSGSQMEKAPESDVTEDDVPF